MRSPGAAPAAAARLPRAAPAPAPAAFAPATPLAARPDQADEVALGVLELPQLEAGHDLLGPEHARAAQALGLGQGRRDVGHLDVERHVPLVALGPAGDAAADPGAVGVRVALALDRPVLHGVVGVDGPAEQLGVVALQRLAVLADDLEVHDGMAHDGLLSMVVVSRSLRPPRRR